MAKVHIKGFVLQTVLREGPIWDYEIVEAVHGYYGLSGDYWTGTVRLALTDLYSCGLLDELGFDVHADRTGGEERLCLRYRVSTFGRERMIQSKLWEG